MIVYELRNEAGELVYRGFSENQVATVRMKEENRGVGPLRMSKIFTMKGKHDVRVIDPLKKYTDKYGKPIEVEDEGRTAR